MLLGTVFTVIGLPAALMLGPMLAGMAVTGCGGHVRIPGPPFILAQGLVGCMIARMLPGLLGGNFGGDIGLFAGGVVAVFAASFGLAWIMIRMSVMPGATILFGMSPGAANVMILMAESYGADAQLVAFMQYLRIVLVTGAASLIAHIFGGGVHAAVAEVPWFGPVQWVPFAQTLLLSVAGPLIASRMRFAAGGLLLPIAAGMVLTHYDLLSIELPRWLMAFAYALIGWRVGLRFTRPLLLHAARAFPRVLACTIALIVACAAIGEVFVLVAHVDPLTAYLSTSPGGADTVAIIAASSNVDTHFVMAMQAVRFVAVLVLLPPMARFVAKRAHLKIV